MSYGSYKNQYTHYWKIIIDEIFNMKSDLDIRVLINIAGSRLVKQVEWDKDNHEKVLKYN